MSLGRRDSADRPLERALQRHSMVAGLTPREELELALAENRRYRAAIHIAVTGLSAARERGFRDASAVIASINEALVRMPLAPRPAPLWPQVRAWLKRLPFRRRPTT